MAASLERETQRDPVDIQIRAALAPTLDPLLAAQSRTPAVANLLAPFFGIGTPLVRCPPLSQQAPYFTSQTSILDFFALAHLSVDVCM